ncbi:hypothetical protein GQ53DRAFT_648882 [Thozetella sp. PMI_491]|nr:hypothetical protein GQ53DRAFT_648882 [Thozetella sp. PMI_491]
MCKYYAHAYVCKHVAYILADLCQPAARIQTPCGDIQIWQTIRLDIACDECKSHLPERSWRKLPRT